MNFTLSKFFQIYKDSNDIYIQNKMEIEIMSKNIFNSLKRKRQVGFLGKDFNSPNEFVKNYYYYFHKAIKTKDSIFFIQKLEIIYAKFLTHQISLE